MFSLVPLGYRHAFRHSAMVPLLLWLLTFLPGEAEAAWPHSPETGLPVCITPANQNNMEIAPDLDGGAIIMWHQYIRQIGWHPRIQRVGSTGTLLWDTPEGVPVVPSPGRGDAHQMISDGFGGVFVLRETLPNELFLHRINSAGKNYPDWPPAGVSIGYRWETDASLLPDGNGGVFVSWVGVFPPDTDAVFAQHITSGGLIAEGWPLSGLPVSRASAESRWPTIVGDSAGGILLFWVEYRDAENNFDICMQHLTANGQLAPGWENFRVIATGPAAQTLRQVISDGTGGAFVLSLMAGPPSPSGIVLMRVNSEGFSSPGWPEAGRLITANQTSNPSMISYGSDDILLVTGASGPQPSDSAVVAYHITSAGEVAPGWDAEGTTVVGSLPGTGDVQAVSDGTGGAIIGWSERQSDGWKRLYAIRITAEGEIPATWPLRGVHVSNYQALGLTLRMVSDGVGGAIWAWNDNQNGQGDIYAAQIDGAGRLGGPVQTASHDWALYH